MRTGRILVTCLSLFVFCVPMLLGTAFSQVVTLENFESPDE